MVVKLVQVAQRAGELPIPEKMKSEVGQGSGQPDLAEGVPAHCRGMHWMTFKGSFKQMVQ